MRRLRFLLPLSLVGAVSILVGCNLTAADEKDKKAPTSEEKFHARLQEIAREYPRYGRVDDESRWAPWLCRAPMPSQARLSASKDEETHGRKLYSMFAKERNNYVGLARLEAAPVGQVIVKESWIPEELKEEPKELKATQRWIKIPVEKGKPGQTQEVSDSFMPYARLDGKLYHALKRGDLFIMYKLDPKTEGTDEGWVYGTVTEDGKKVTSAGKVESCMGCHQKSKTDRLFGLPPK